MISISFCRDSDISSSMGALMPKQWNKNYDTGAESGDDLEEEDFSKYVDIGF